MLSKFACFSLLCAFTILINAESIIVTADDDLVESQLGGGILFDHCKVSTEDKVWNFVDVLDTSSLIDTFAKNTPEAFKKGGDQYVVQYANMCFRHTVDYCDKKDFTYAYISHKSFWGKNCARLTGSTPPEIQTSNFSYGLDLTYAPGDQCLTNPQVKYQILIEMECATKTIPPTFHYNTTTCLLDIFMGAPAGCYKKVIKPEPPVPLNGDCIYNVSNNLTYYIYGVYGTRDMEFAVPGNMSIYHNLCEFTGHRCGESNRIYAFLQNNSDTNCWTITGAKAEINQIQDGVVKIDYGVGEKCLADPRNHYSSAAYIYCNETANHTTAKFNQTGCQYNFNYYSKYGIKRTKTSAYNCLGCVNTVPDRPAPHNWVKSSLSDSCTVADGSNTYSLSKIFNNKGFNVSFDYGLLQIGLCQKVSKQCKGYDSYAIYFSNTGGQCARFAGTSIQVYSASTMLRLDYSFGQMCDADDNHQIQMYLICDPDAETPQITRNADYACFIEFRVASKYACASTTSPGVTTTVTSSQPKTFAFSLSTFLFSVILYLFTFQSFF